MTAFVHKSYAMDYTQELHHNERLEFLGDTILGAAIADKLYTNYPNDTEAQLTLYKITLVREETLALVAKEIKLGEYIFISNGEEKMNGREKLSILSDCLEALIWYIYHDLWYEEAFKFIIRHIYKKMECVEDLMPIKSYKSRVQELIQKEFKLLPTYKDEETKVDKTWNITQFTSHLSINDTLLSTGTGTSKKKAQEDAAKNYINKAN